MECKHFGECGACRVYENGYEAQLAQKHAQNKERFKELYSGEIELFASPQSHYRARAEFRIWHTQEGFSYAMTSVDKKAVLIEECPQVNEHIASMMPRLLKSIAKAGIEHKLFGCDFLSASATGEMVVSLLYHRPLDEEWQQKATEVARELGINIIGRSRGQKLVIGRDFVIERLQIASREFLYKHIENSFTQPNPKVNEQMVSWALANCSAENGRDLLELYCGAGNFTIPFATRFNKVLATEISKSSIAAAKENMKLNDIHNIEFVRMSVEEFTQALEGVREFNRMKHIDIAEYDFSSVFVDPPRAGMDAMSRDFVSRFDEIVYISCNPETLKRDLQHLVRTHEVTKMALFDQFPYTHHAEMGAVLRKKGAEL